MAFLPEVDTPTSLALLRREGNKKHIKNSPVGCQISAVPGPDLLFFGGGFLGLRFFRPD